MSRAVDNAARRQRVGLEPGRLSWLGAAVRKFEGAVVLFKWCPKATEGELSIMLAAQLSAGDKRTFNRIAALRYLT